MCLVVNRIVFYNLGIYCLNFVHIYLINSIVNFPKTFIFGLLEESSFVFSHNIVLNDSYCLQ